MPRIVKRKATGFFKPEDLNTIRTAVKDGTSIISEASILVRAYYLHWFEEEIKKKKYGHDNVLALDDELLGWACSIVQGKFNPPFRGANRTNAKKLERFNSLVSTFKAIYDNNPPIIESDLSMSHILTYSIGNLLTAYNNNITIHFEKYPKKYIRCDLLSKGFEKKEAIHAAGIITGHYMFNNNNDIDVDGKLDDLDDDIYVAEYADLFPINGSNGRPRVYDIEANPWRYLFKMVGINRAIELAFPDVPTKNRKLCNPVPFHSSYIPMHIRLDTSGISQLLMTQKRIKEFKQLYAIEKGVDLQMVHKGDMLLSFERLVGRPITSAAEGAMYATDTWAFLTNLRTCKQWGEINQTMKDDVKWVFDNAILTDGVSISIQIIEEEKMGRKAFMGKKKTTTEEKKSNKKDEFDTSKGFAGNVDGKKQLGCDPGKMDLLAITDGFKTLRYTSKQRNNDTYKRQRMKEASKRRKKESLDTYESDEMSKHPKNTCFLESFKSYLLARKLKEGLSKDVYQRPFFRQMKFLTFAKTRSSEMKFFDKVFKTFKGSQPLALPENAPKHGDRSTPRNKFRSGVSMAMIVNALLVVHNVSQFIIGYGNWGRNPNLKNNAPTPGIGLRRRMASYFQTLTVNEYLTSQTCPCCKHERVLTNPKIGDITRHHLLRCTNDTCKSRW